MNNSKIIEYLLEKERQQYVASVEHTKTVRHIAIALIIALTVCVCFYMYYVVPEEEVTVDGNSKVVMESNITNGSNVWQSE